MQLYSLSIKLTKLETKEIILINIDKSSINSSSKINIHEHLKELQLEMIVKLRIR